MSAGEDAIAGFLTYDGREILTEEEKENYFTSLDFLPEYFIRRSRKRFRIY